MQQLYLVGFTADLEGLIFSLRRSAKSGAYILPLEDDLMARIEEMQRLRGGGTSQAVPRAAPVAAAAANRERSRSNSALSVREIQARLRAGHSAAEVAEQAGVDEDWIGRFAPPVRAEQARVVETALPLVFSTSRRGPSAHPLGQSVRWNLADRTVLMDDEAFLASWSAFQLTPGRWVVRFEYASRGRGQVAEWEIDVNSDELVPRNRLARDLGFVEPGVRTHVQDEDVAPPRPLVPARQQAWVRTSAVAGSIAARNEAGPRSRQLEQHDDEAEGSEPAVRAPVTKKATAAKKGSRARSITAAKSTTTAKKATAAKKASRAKSASQAKPATAAKSVTAGSATAAKKASRAKPVTVAKGGRPAKSVTAAKIVGPAKGGRPAKSVGPAQIVGPAQAGRSARAYGEGAAGKSSGRPPARRSQSTSRPVPTSLAATVDATSSRTGAQAGKPGGVPVAEQAVQDRRADAATPAAAMDAPARTPARHAPKSSTPRPIAAPPMPTSRPTGMEPGSGAKAPPVPPTGAEPAVASGAKAQGVPSRPRPTAAAKGDVPGPATNEHRTRPERPVPPGSGAEARPTGSAPPRATPPQPATDLAAALAKATNGTPRSAGVRRLGPQPQDGTERPKRNSLDGPADVAAAPAGRLQPPHVVQPSAPGSAPARQTSPPVVVPRRIGRVVTPPAGRRAEPPGARPSEPPAGADSAAKPQDQAAAQERRSTPVLVIRAPRASSPPPAG